MDSNFAPVAAIVVVPGARDRIVSNRAEGPQSIENHLDSWYLAWRIALDHPLVGTGQETFPDVFPSYSHDLLSPERVAYFDQYRVESPHNVFLGIGASTGLILFPRILIRSPKSSASSAALEIVSLPFLT